MNVILQGKTADLGDPYFARELGVQLSARLPLLYGMIAANSLLVAWAYQGTRPFFLNTALPAFAIAVYALRAWHWRPAATLRRPTDVVLSDLDRMPNLGLAFGLLTAAWGLSLYGYGNSFQ